MSLKRPTTSISMEDAASKKLSQTMWNSDETATLSQMSDPTNGHTIHCVASGATHQGDKRFLGNGIQCTSISFVASIYRIIKKRSIFTKKDFEIILKTGDALYIKLEPLIPADVYPRYLSFDELSNDVRIEQHSVTIENMKDSWIANGLYPDCKENKDSAIHRLVDILEDDVFNSSHNDDTDSFIFTGQDYTISFWRCNNRYFIFNSHGVDRCNKNCGEGVARVFECNNVNSLAEALLMYNCKFRGGQYLLSRVRVLNDRIDEDMTVSITESPTEESQSILLNLSSSVLPTYNDPSPTDEFASPSILCNLSPLIKETNKENISITVESNDVEMKTDEKLTTLKPVVVLEKVDDFKLSVLKPVVVVEPLISSTTTTKTTATKRGRPKKNKLGRKKTKENAHLDAVKKYNEKNPQVNRESVAKYTNKKPEVHRGAVKKYDATHPEVHRDAVKKYDATHPEVHRDAVKKYDATHPEVHRDAVKKYDATHPEVHRDAVKKYDATHPEVNRDAVKKYNKTHPEVHRDAAKKYNENHPDVNSQTSRNYNILHPEVAHQSASQYNENNRNIDVPLRRSHNLIGEKRGEELDAVQSFSLKKPCLTAPDIHRCPHCHTRLFDEEKPRVKWCCGSGANNVQNFTPLTEDFYTHPSFLKRPRAYNNLFAFSALGVSHGFQQPEGISFLKIQGRVYHRVFDLGYNRSTNNIGLYINDSSERENIALGQNLDLTVTRSITNFLHNVNPHIECFKRLSLETAPEAFIMFEKTSRATHGNILGDQPVGREVSAIISTDREQFTPRCIAIWNIGESQAHTVDIMHVLYESFQFPLLYPEGNAGWYPGKLDNNGNKLTQARYVRCLLLSETRFSEFERLSEEWLVDMYCRIEEERLRYLSHMQKKTESRDGNEMRTAPLQELLNDETITAEGVVPGRIYLPNTFTGSPRYMKVKYLDCIALVNRLGPPSYFITFTCNPNWPEIKESKPPGQRASPLICCRVFNLRLNTLIRDIRSGKWFGKIEYLTYVIEFQKRGLPHAHICFRVEGGGPAQSFDIDKVCRADIPNPLEADGRLRKAVLNHMIHGPCGDNNRHNLPCYDRERKRCTKRFPKRETDVTHSDDKGFINLRRNSGNEAVIKYRNIEFTVNDLWVVPYNAALLLKYDAHINVEISSQRSVVKYLFKYMTKGPDEARVTVVAEEQLNEIEQYATKRYIGSSDAAWRVLEFDVTTREPNVKQLSVHLKNQQSVYFRPSNVDDAVNRGSSDLLTYFNRPSGEQFDNLKYVDFYEKFIVHAKRPSTKNVQIYESTNGKFITPRQRGELVARLFWVAPNRGEQFYLRILLNSFPCRSYEDLMNLGGANCTTFQDAAKAVGLADDEIEYEEALLEASTFFTGRRLRYFFVTLANIGAPAATLWSKFKDQLSEDILHRFPNDKEKAYNLCLLEISRILQKHGSTLVQHGLPDVEDDTTEIGRERIEYDTDAQISFVDEWLPKLSSDQRTVFEYINRLCEDEQYRATNPCAIFVDGPAGTGKTLLLNAVTAHIRGSLKGIVLCTASSAIAAQNHEGGVTAHSMFKYPFEFVDDNGYWNITNGSQRAELIYHANVIIYDEAPMAHKYLIHLLDRSLRDLMNSDKIFGGKIIVFAGDFRQIPPVVKNARTNSDIYNSSVKSSPLWQQLKTFTLVNSQRCSEDNEYADFLLKLGSDELDSIPLRVGQNKIQWLVSIECIERVSNLSELIDFVYPWMVIDEPDVCAHRAILSTRNDSVRAINTQILDRLPGEILHFYSVDKVDSESADELYLGPDALNRLQPQGVPDFDLKLKIGCVCIIMRNLSFADGLVNGTKVIVVSTSPRLIKVRKPGGLEDYLIPRILFKAPIDRDSPIEMIRRQYPLQLAYAMTIHKSQGKTISRVGLDLSSEVFSHGMLYVALSRVSKSSDIKILLHTDRIINETPYSNNIVISELIS